MGDAILDFLEPVNLAMISNDLGYKEGQIGKIVSVYEDEFPDVEDAHLIIVGCRDQRGAALLDASEAPDAIRRELYALYHWHADIRIADIGNVVTGSSIYDTYAALKVVLYELQQAGKLVLVLGGSHDLSLAQYHVFGESQDAVDGVGVDAIIDINLDSPFRADNFLMEVLTSEPNYLRHYNHIAFQSYYVHPRMLETMDKLRFDCFRVGHVRERLEEMEPVIRNCSFMSFDVSALAHACAPGNAISPNGLYGDEACTLMQYAGMSHNMQTVGLYGYRPERDADSLTAKQLSQMIWYLMDGRSRGVREAGIDERESFNEFHTAFAEVETVFLQSKKTGRWWMQLPDKNFIACSYKDYLLASSNEIPERWLRAQERP